MALVVGAGLGIGVMPKEVARRSAAKNGMRVVQLDEPWTKRSFHLAVRAESALSAAGRLVLAHLRGTPSQSA